MMTNVLLVTICAVMSVKVGWADPEMSNETDIRLLTSAVSAFSRDVYRTLHIRALNFVFSPFTAHSALSMTYMGAMHDTMRHLRDGLWVSCFCSMFYRSFKATSYINLFSNLLLLRNLLQPNVL